MSIEFIHGLDQFKRSGDRSAVVTVGTFDGIHLGHQEILRRVLHNSKNGEFDTILVTFHPHPRVVVTPDSAPRLLTTLQEKKRWLPDFFRGTVLVLDFDDALKSMEAEQFVKEILLKRLGMHKLVVGYDHAFGKNRSGTIVELNRLGKVMGFEVEVVGPVLDGETRISSSLIRRTLAEGDFADALRYLGHPYAIYGTVEKGIGLGRKIGYPTANIKYGERKQLPAEGVYACKVLIDGKRLDGMMFIGRNHFNPGSKVTVEANLFDFDADIYFHDIAVCPTHFLRKNRRFDSPEALVAQIEFDKKEVLRIIQQEMRNVS
ncbi:MAG TPA: bifunctional riboflavin kinase/FAD synthetase [candidate division Zixibacteria bacterium]|nr:bifunctional riboflavin kinase/FAD synthetase [candidate division Zixibacteria bacterium]